MPATTAASKTIDPFVQEQLSQGEATLAEFMDSLSKSISRYNTLLAKALPQNPKAHFYYYAEEEKKTTDATVTPTADDAPSDEKKPKIDDETIPKPAATTTTSSEGKKPTSPLLRRPQLDKAELEKIQTDAKQELLKRQTSVGEFPMVDDSNENKEVTVKAHTKGKSHAADGKKRKHDSHHHSGHGHHHTTKKHSKKTEDGEEEDAADAAEAEGEEVSKHTTKKTKAKKEPKSILPTFFGLTNTDDAKGKKKKDAKKKKDDEEVAVGDEESTKVLTAEEAAVDADDWEDETDEEAAGADGEMTVEQLFAKIAPSPQLLQEMRVLKKEARELSEKFEIIHDWIAMNLPALATEDAEGTSVMAAVIESLSGFMETIDGIYEQESTYLGERTQLELAFLQNPEIATGLALIALLDNDAWDAIEAGYRAIIRCHLIAHSQLSKNMEQLRAPIRRRINLSM